MRHLLGLACMLLVVAAGIGSMFLPDLLDRVTKYQGQGDR